MYSLTPSELWTQCLEALKRKGGVCKQNKINVDNACIHSSIHKVFAANYLCILKQIMLVNLYRLFFTLII